MTLDIVVPHYKEPWEDGKKLFDMLAIQRDVDFSDFRVLLVNDGEENDISEKVFRQHYPFEVVSIVIPHAGVSAARNRGIRYSNAEWLMFCDFDDCFTSIYSLRVFLDAMETQKYDMLWSPFYVEIDARQKRQIKEKFNLIFIHAKAYRRRVLIEHGVFFEESLHFSEDAAFNQLLGMEIDGDRIGALKSEVIPYVWTFRPGSITTDPENTCSNEIGLFRRQKYVAMQHLNHGDPESHNALCIRAMCDAYVAFNRQGFSFDNSDYDREVWEFWKDKKHVDIRMCGGVILEAALNGALREFGLTKDNLRPDALPFDKWLEAFTRQHEGGD